MTGDVIVRRPRAGDFAAVLDCLAAYRFHVLGSTPCADPDFAADEVLTVRNQIGVIDLDRRSWVAEHDGVVVGFCCWDWHDRGAREAKTVLISVRPEARRLGAGHKLQSARQDEMRAAGARLVHTWSDDPAAIHWYCNKFGYEQLGAAPIHHCLHLIRHGAQAAWGIHRGHRASEHLVHLRLVLEAPRNCRVAAAQLLQ